MLIHYFFPLLPLFRSLIYYSIFLANYAKSSIPTKGSNISWDSLTLGYRPYWWMYLLICLLIVSKFIWFDLIIISLNYLNLKSGKVEKWKSGKHEQIYWLNYFLYFNHFKHQAHTLISTLMDKIIVKSIWG